MCRNIKRLRHSEHPPTDQELHDAALQFVRKISGTTKPSKANEELFNRAVADVTHIARHLIDDLVTNAAPRNREQEARKLRELSMKRFPRGDEAGAANAAR